MEVKKSYTVADMREAFVQGYMHLWNYVPGAADRWPLRKAVEEALRRYPNPVRPREIKVDNGAGRKLGVRVVDGALQYQPFSNSSVWSQLHTAEDTAAIKDILNNPTEPVLGDE